MVLKSVVSFNEQELRALILKYEAKLKYLRFLLSEVGGH